MSRTPERPSAEVVSSAGDHPAAAIARTASAVVRATGELQESMARRTGTLQREAAHQLRLATNPAELMNVQAAMLMAGWQHSLQCGTDLAKAWFSLGLAGALPARGKPSTH